MVLIRPTFEIKVSPQMKSSLSQRASHLKNLAGWLTLVCALSSILAERVTGSNKSRGHSFTLAGRCASALVIRRCGVVEKYKLSLNSRFGRLFPAALAVDHWVGIGDSLCRL
jgi:hypothetical protein